MMLDATYLVIFLVGFIGGLAIVGVTLERIEQRRAHAAAEKAARDREDAYYARALKTASQLGTVWPPIRERRS